VVILQEEFPGYLTKSPQVNLTIYEARYNIAVVYSALSVHDNNVPILYCWLQAFTMDDIAFKGLPGGCGLLPVDIRDGLYRRASVDREVGVDGYLV